VHCVCLNHRSVCFIGDNSSVIPVYHSLQDWFNSKLIKLPCFVFPDFRICSGMCSSKLPFASEKRYVNIFYRYYSATTKKMLKLINVFTFMYFRCDGAVPRDRHRRIGLNNSYIITENNY
jgi:hypothetical protein